MTFETFSTYIPETVTSIEELVEHLNTEINSTLINADGDYVDLSGTVVDEENSIKKWVPQNYLNFQKDDENLLVTFKSSNINFQTDSEISLTVTGDSSREQEEPQQSLDIRVFEGFSESELETLENKAIAISNGTSTLLMDLKQLRLTLITW